MTTVGGRKAAGTAARDIEDFSDDYADDEEYESETGEVVSAVSQALSPLSAEEKALLKQLSEYAAKNSQRPDCKAQTLIDWLKKTPVSYTHLDVYKRQARGVVTLPMSFGLNPWMPPMQ